MSNTVLIVLVCILCAAAGCAQELPPDVARHVIPLEIPVAEDSAGSLIAADLDGEWPLELLVTAPGYLGAYSVDGSLMWSREVDIRVGGQSESQGLPGHHGPGVQAADINGDGATEVLFLTQDSTLHVLAGPTGEPLWSVTIPHPDGAERWEHLAVANFRGEGDRDVLLQATNAEGYRMGRYVAAFALEALREGRIEPLWSRDDFLACAHNGARLADIDGDGRDEVLGGTVLDNDGSIIGRFPLRGHVDSIYAADVRPDLPGLEIVALEEGGSGEERNRVFVLSANSDLLVSTHFNNQEPQNAAVGHFDAERDGVQVWCRSRYNQHQKPFVFDAHGELIAHWEMDDVAPEGWTTSGVEVIWTIDWSGGEEQFAAAKERHTEGDVCVFNPITGEFVVRMEETASRIYVADVLGDWREEIVVWNNDELRVYENLAPNPRPDRPRLWSQPHYTRSKQVWNYYSP
ncbi:MAG: hypothetical protein ACOX9R_03115 [Armatimonadota bacterium]|jgi:hypothetical protein